MNINTPQSLPQFLFFTADPVLALEIRALQLSYAQQFDIQCKRSLSELKAALNNQFHEVVFLDLSFQNAPAGIVHIINTLSPATLIYLIEGASGTDFNKLCNIINEGRIYRYLPRPFNLNAHLSDVEQAAARANICYKMMRAGTKMPMVVQENLPEVIILHPDFRFGAKAREACSELARVCWAANLVDLVLLLQKYTPYAIITAAQTEEGSLLPACHFIHHQYPGISFGMIQEQPDNHALIAGINGCAVLQVNNAGGFLQDPETFLSKLYDTYEAITNEPWRMNLFAPESLPPIYSLDEPTRHFFHALKKINDNAG